MNRNMKPIQNLFSHKVLTIKLVVKELQCAKIYAILLVSVMLAGIFSFSPAISLLMNDVVVIRSTGKMATANGTAISGSARDIQAAVDEVVAAGGIGDVHIPAGTFNFVEIGEPWITVNVPAGVNIFGAPTERDANGQVIEWETVLVMPYDVPSTLSAWETWFTITGNGDTNEPSRFSDIKLIGYRDFDPTSTSVHFAMEIFQVMDFRIDHCFFKHTTLGVAIDGGSTAMSRGVIDHNNFINEYGIGYPYGSLTIGYGIQPINTGSSNWDDNIDNVVGKYTNYTVFIEDNYFSKWRHCVASNDGAHYVFRHNTIENDFGYASLDAHGLGYPQGTRAVEIYDNLLLNATDDPNWAIHIRGGGGTIFNNTVRGYYQPGRYSNFLHLTNDNPNGYRVHDVWVWDNDVETGMIFLLLTGTITENVDYFLYEKPDYQPYPYPHPLTLEAYP